MTPKTWNNISKIFSAEIIEWHWLPFTILVIYYNSRAQLPLYVMTYSVYFPICLFLKKALSGKLQLVFPLLFTALFVSSRVLPLSTLPNTQDLHLFAAYTVKHGEQIEQDFWLPNDNWRYRKALNNQNTGLVLRLLSDLDLQKSSILIGNTEIGALTSTLIKSNSSFYGSKLIDSYFRVPKNLLTDGKITVTLRSENQFAIAYSSGIHPLPASPHTRLITAGGKIQDLSAQYHHRRFRFQIVFYIVDYEHLTEADAPIIVGTLY